MLPSSSKHLAPKLPLLPSALQRALTTSTAVGAAAPSLFAHVPEAPKDPILGITELCAYKCSQAFLKDQNPHKINLGVGAYRDDDCKPVVLESVREAERRVMGTHFMEYLPIGGLKDFVHESVKLAYGPDAECVREGTVAAVQSLSGTGSCRLMGDFMKRFMPDATIFISTPTWANHLNIFRDAGVPQATYRYYKPSTKGLDFEGFMEDVQAAPNNSVFLLHACAHNPTGVDPTPDQWRQLSKVFKEKRHFPFFDMAYQGFASGDCERDAQAIRIFLADGHNMGCSQSYAKNMGLYGQRVGAFSIVTNSKKEAAAVESQMKNIARPMYSNPPLHGALLVAKILQDPALKNLWYDEVKMMAHRIILMRTVLKKNLEDLKTPGPWEHITEQIGMFAFSGMTPEHVDRLAHEHSIYMTRNGRISMAGITSKNVNRLAEAMNQVITNSK